MSVRQPRHDGPARVGGRATDRGFLLSSDLAATPDDSHVVVRMQLDDEAALGALYDRHATAVMRLCADLGLDRRRSEDALLVTFLEAWTQRRRMELTSGTVRPWLLALTCGVVLGDRPDITRRHRKAVKRYRSR